MSMLSNIFGGIPTTVTQTQSGLMDLAPEKMIDEKVITDAIKQPDYIPPTMLADLVQSPAAFANLNGADQARIMASQGINPLIQQQMMQQFYEQQAARNSRRGLLG